MSKTTKAAGSWLDEVVAIPTVGVHLKTALLTQHEIMDRVRSLVESWGSFRIVDASPMDLKLERSNGFNYSVRPDAIVIDFLYASLVSNTIDGKTLPAMQYEREVTPYSELLSEAMAEAISFTDAILGRDTRQVIRMGVVAKANLAVDSLPPGLAGLTAYLEQPWPQRVQVTEFRNLVTLDVQETHNDRCHHRMKCDHVDSQALDLFLDFQRVFVDGKAQLKSGRTASSLTNCMETALSYFDSFAAREYP